MLVYSQSCGESAPHTLGTAPAALIGSLRSQHGFAIKTRKKYFLELAKDVVPSCVAFNHAGVGHCKLYKIPFIVLFDWKMQSGGGTNMPSSYPQNPNELLNDPVNLLRIIIHTKGDSYGTMRVFLWHFNCLNHMRKYSFF